MVRRLAAHTTTAYRRQCLAPWPTTASLLQILHYWNRDARRVGILDPNHCPQKPSEDLTGSRERPAITHNLS